MESCPESKNLRDKHIANNIHGELVCDLNLQSHGPVHVIQASD